MGKSVVLFEIYKLILEICRNFDFRLADPDHEWACAGDVGYEADGDGYGF